MSLPLSTMDIEDRYAAPFFRKTGIAVERGDGVYVWDEEGKRYIDLTAGWGVTCIGHASPVITRALTEQSTKIIQNPNSGLTYSPARARLMSLLAEILPKGLTRIFFSNSGAESNDAVIKLARKVKGRLNVVSTLGSFHGRTISTASATGQDVHRNKYNPLMPNYVFVPFDDIDALDKAVDETVAAVILEPIQGEGGVRVPRDGYLETVSRMCRERGVLLIVDEVQTGFCRTGPMFASDKPGVTIDMMTMAKGIAGGFPFGAFAMTEEVAAKLEVGDHGGTFSGNPLGCAVSHAVIRHLIDNDISGNVERVGDFTRRTLKAWRQERPETIMDVRGRGLLIALELAGSEAADRVGSECLARGLILNVKHGTIIRIFPALTITREEMQEALAVLKNAVDRL